MSRTVPAALLTALAQPQVQPFYAVEMAFDSGTVRLWTGYGERTINGETYVGAGTLLNIDGLSEVADLSARAITIRLSGIASELVSLALQEAYQRRRCRVYFGATQLATDDAYAVGGVSPRLVFDFTGEYYQVGEPAAPYDVVEVFSGSLNTMPIEDSGDSSVIMATVDSKLVETDKASNLRYTSEGQKSRYPGDTFFDYVSAIQDAEIVWGRTKA
jgi:hypothetical protein